MLYIIFAAIALGAASRFLWLQYHRKPGDAFHAKRGITITLLATAALFSIEYALWNNIVILFKYLPLLVLHLFFAIPTLIALGVITATGIATYRTTFRTKREEHDRPLPARTHRFLAKYFWYAWIATITTGLMFFVASIRS
ncbi:MAG: hypothetical protein Q7S09_04080 [bacterium]|nr:hypothetical protein [bacterium]